MFSSATPEMRRNSLFIAHMSAWSFPSFSRICRRAKSSPAVRRTESRISSPTPKLSKWMQGPIAARIDEALTPIESIAAQARAHMPDALPRPARVDGADRRCAVVTQSRQKHGGAVRRADRKRNARRVGIEAVALTLRAICRFPRPRADAVT